MRIPQGDWVVVERPVRDTTSRGQIIRHGLTEKQAKYQVADYRATQARQLREGTDRIVCDYWAIDKRPY